MRALGSGFLVGADDYIVTNNHVVDGASSVKVNLDDGTERPARVAGRDPRTDIAVLETEAGRPLPYLAFGDSDHAQAGDWVVAVGNPFGLGGSVTAGVISAHGRNIGAGPYDDIIQIDAPINQGNSGGPLFALDGTVIGVNTAIVSPPGGSVGIGFAIPSNMVRNVVMQLETSGHVERGFLGVTTQPLTTTLAETLHLPTTHGALTADVMPDSPAASGGLHAGDVATAVEGRSVTDHRDLARNIAEMRPGSQVTLGVLRDGRTRDRHARLTSLPDKPQAQATAALETGRDGMVGIALGPLEEAARQQLHVPGKVREVVVADVRAESPAAEAGPRPGDVITAVAGREVANAEQAAHELRTATRGNTAVTLCILRDGQSLFMALPAQHKG